VTFFKVLLLHTFQDLTLSGTSVIPTSKVSTTTMTADGELKSWQLGLWHPYQVSWISIYWFHSY